jgi:hypothetical protein
MTDYHKSIGGEQRKEKGEKTKLIIVRKILGFSGDCKVRLFAWDKDMDENRKRKFQNSTGTV